MAGRVSGRSVVRKAPDKWIASGATPAFSLTEKGWDDGSNPFCYRLLMDNRLFLVGFGQRHRGSFRQIRFVRSFQRFGLVRRLRRIILFNQ